MIIKKLSVYLPVLILDAVRAVEGKARNHIMQYAAIFKGCKNDVLDEK